jgi:RNA polymerase sporulation-specific sigma factor
MVSLEDYLDHAGTAVSAEDDFLAAESVARLSRALEQQLSPMENEVLRLHISGFRYADIATRLNKSPKAVDNALQRIRKKLTLLFE